MKVFVQGNNATALEVRRQLQHAEKYAEKHPNQKHYCMSLVDNPKDADATFAVESAVNGRGPMGMSSYTSSAELTSSDGTLLWSDSLGDGSKFMDQLAGSSPAVNASRLLVSAQKAVCKGKL